MRTTLIEPTIAEMLDDPIVGVLMERDGVTVEALRRLLDETRRRLQRGHSRPKPSGLAANSEIDVMTLA